MQELTGKFTEAKVFTNDLDQRAHDQIVNLLNQPFMAGSKVRVMPDVHAGMGSTIGTTLTITDKVVPNLVGVDIGCGMETVRLDTKDVDYKRLDRLIRQQIPAGFNIRKNKHPYVQKVDLDALRAQKAFDRQRAERSIGTLGGGNHFIEVNRDDQGNKYLVIHSGSRNLGHSLATHYQSLAVEHMKRQGLSAHVEDALAYLEGQELEDYLHDVAIAQQYAYKNRMAMIDTILEGMGWCAEDHFTTIHNYIDHDTNILRKGAVSAQKGERLLIPFNMRDGSLIAIGKGNPDWNYSAPHGAGRQLSRTAARKRGNLQAFRKEMEGIYSTSISNQTLDEAPFAYKPMADIVDNIEDTVEIEKHIRPVYNFKA